MDIETKKYIDDLVIALQEIPKDYFKIKTTYSEGIVRERVFCYEFYHQIRSIQRFKHPLLFHGEINKRGHNEFEKDDQKDPDFVLHQPGTFSNNKIVIEVKGTLNNRGGIESDFDKIYSFIEKYNYDCGVFILYNHSYSELLKEYEPLLVGISEREFSDKIVIITIKKPNTMPIVNFLKKTS